jgi:hypothetical protein
VAGELDSFERGLLQSMENVARSLPDVPDDVVQSQLETFEMLAGTVGSYCWEPAARLLGQTAEGCVDQTRRDRILRVAEALAARAADTDGSQAPKTELEAPGETLPRATPAPAVVPEFGVSEFFTGMTVRVARGFVDDDGRLATAGEVLHFRKGSYFHYDDGYTLTFQERVIRLSGNDPDERAVIQNSGNSYFEPLPDPEALRGCLAAIDDQWACLGPGESGRSAAVRTEIENCRQWLARPEPRGPAPACLTAPLAAVVFPDRDRTLGLARLIAFLFAGIRACRPV